MAYPEDLRPTSTQISRSKRALALRIAENIEKKWPHIHLDGFDVDECMEIIELEIPPHILKRGE